MMDEELSIKERLAMLERDRENIKEKKFRLPFGSKIGKKKAKEGWVTVVTINDNKSLNFTKAKIIDGTIKLEKGDLSFHAIAEEDIFFYKNKPIIFQPKRKLNPYNPLMGQHETYGQKYIMARLEGDKISVKKGLGWGMSIGAIIIIAIVAYAFLTGGGG